MSLSVGAKLGPYEILAPLGAGGMGEVYRARDTKLDRYVAIKVLPDALAQHPERLARFDREAKVLAALNHPNIAHIYGIEQRALVMELVEGESPKGPMPFEEAWKIALQMAEALEYAHEKGVVHRDLKPANIKITPDGVVKLLDFGLAKAYSDSPDSTGTDSENSPTVTLGATVAGTIMGTAAYMAPEQARGKRVEKRADIWSWGVVLYELLTGERMFQGDDAAETLAAVIHKQPELDRVSARVRRLLRRCLEKDPKQRLRDIGEARFLLDDEATPRSVSKAGPWWKIASAVLAIVALAFGYIAYRHWSEETRVLKLSVLMPPGNSTYGRLSIPAVSPDGRHVVFAAIVDGRVALWVRDLDGLSARPLPGTDGATYPFWSSDGRWIAFFAGGSLKKIDASGGPPSILCDAGQAIGGTWNREEVIVYGVINGGLFRVPASGGMPTPITHIARSPYNEINHQFPWFLPDGRHVIYTARAEAQAEKTRIYIADINALPESQSRRVIVAANSNAVYTAPGYLLYTREGTLMAQPFDASKDQTTGDATPVAEHVDVDPGIARSYFSASQNGILVYTSGSFADSKNVQLTWLDRAGKVLGTVGNPGYVDGPAISPDGNLAAFARTDPTGLYNIWLHDLVRGTEPRFTFGTVLNRFPVWSPDGRHIAFGSPRNGGFNVYQKATTGVARDELLDKDPERTKYPTDWSRDGNYIIEETYAAPKTGNDIWVLPTFGDKKPFPYVNSEADEELAKLSPNGQWLAYQSNETKRYEIYVQTFPTPGGKWQVSSDGGTFAAWSRDGKELFFIGGGKMMAVVVKPSSNFEPSAPKALFDVRTNSRFDVSRDGRFLVAVPVDQGSGSAAVPLTVWVNWPAALKK